MAIDLDVAAAGFTDEWCGGAPAATATLVALLKQAKGDGADEARAQMHAAPAVARKAAKKITRSRPTTKARPRRR